MAAGCQIAANENRRGERQGNANRRRHQPGSHRAVGHDHQHHRSQNKRQEEVRIHHQRDAEHHGFTDVEQTTRRGDFPQLFHLGATAAQQHKDHQPQQGTSSTGRNPQIVKLLGDNVRDRLITLKRHQVF
ncbi:hypothetical protein D3C73_1270120 [compost metagenome]